MMHYKKEMFMMYCIIKNDVYISDIRKNIYMVKESIGISNSLYC